MDLVNLSATVAGILATGAVEGAGAYMSVGLLKEMAERVRNAFAGDRRSLAVLDQVRTDPSDSRSRHDLAEALKWYAERDEQLASDLQRWVAAAPPLLTQNLIAQRDAYAAGNDQTINHYHWRED
ncbi:hypothetical protein GCM10028790_00530 [Micromonospora taraxaci]|uniref:Uncharacterized protein n=1 Tax=Micromonospora taraxaci TaxID=1316803 RepID=A0A561W5H8_9ACTN|nr:hypothetical protein [Micromonospora taraxaci]TWG19108.1 hypothetical protein FHU34_114488 [Micromonospora taraxaci]